MITPPLAPPLLRCALPRFGSETVVIDPRLFPNPTFPFSIYALFLDPSTAATRFWGQQQQSQAAAAAPHLIMTYCALLALAILRDDYAPLDRAALARLVGACQYADGGCENTHLLLLHRVTRRDLRTPHPPRFATIPGAGDADLRMSYCALAICALLPDW